MFPDGTHLRAQNGQERRYVDAAVPRSFETNFKPDRHESDFHQGGDRIHLSKNYTFGLLTDKEAVTEFDARLKEERKQAGEKV